MKLSAGVEEQFEFVKSKRHLMFIFYHDKKAGNNLGVTKSKSGVTKSKSGLTKSKWLTVVLSMQFPYNDS